MQRPVFAGRTLASRLFFLGLPLIALILLLVFVVGQRSVLRVINSAIARNAQLQAQTVGGGLSQILQDARSQLLVLAAGSLDEASMVQRLSLRVQPQAMPYREVVFLATNPAERYVLLRHGDEFLSLPQHVAVNALSSPFQSGAPLKGRGQVSVSQPVEVMYPLVQVGDEMQNLGCHVLRFSTVVHDQDGGERGVLMLSIDLAALRDRLSQLTAPDSPMNKGMEENLRGVFFDRNGWMLFQSEDTSVPEWQKLPLRADRFRTGLNGDLGRPDFRSAFRPNTDHSDYWTVVVAVREGKSGHLATSGSGWQDTLEQGEEVSYAPVTYQSSPDAPLVTIGGVALLGRDFTINHAMRSIYGIYVTGFVVGLLLFALCLRWLVRSMSQRIDRLADQLDARNSNGSDAPLELDDLPLDLDRIREGADALLARLRQLQSERQAQAALRSAQLRDAPADNMPPMPTSEGELRGLVGSTAAMQTLFADIANAAQVSADVLIVGETGTGKELAAAAIHQQSRRASGPYISINCGALDENLLMDTLFGHVKGAFTEAKQARKGAFLAAAGGTLLLDEVGNAAPKVQQALLRALSTRAIRPLGADHDIPFDTRVIAATNADLRSAGEQGDFRHDLYYRLAVITIHTPPLRERKEDIPALVVQFMALARQDADTGRIGPLPEVSRGALAKLLQHDWPGNVRELKNVINRSLAFCSSDILLADDIRLDTPLPQASLPQTALPGDVGDSGEPASQPLAPVDTAGLTPRQKTMLDKIRRSGSTTRQEYQNMAGVSMRTAQYDLQQLVRLGVLRKEGRGPSQRYVCDTKSARKAKTE